ncbi:MAG: thioredoxin family protein [Candidatus Thorarchaeota archaeon]|nr:thioredoxin family protein [Candidatus Thorarchaeota archaeon]
MNEEKDRSKIDSMARRLEAAMQSGSENLANGELNELEADYQDQIRQARTSIVEFYRTTCPYCRQMMAVLEELAKTYRSKVFFAKVNIDNVEDPIDRFKILGVPLTIAFKKGMPVSRMDGFQDQEAVERWVSALYQGIRPSDLTSGQVTSLT